MLPTHANQTYTYTHSCWMQWKGKWKGGTWQKVLGVIFVVFILPVGHFLFVVLVKVYIMHGHVLESQSVRMFCLVY